MYSFRFHVVDTLPKLAWCAVLDAGKDYVELFHGPWVEVRQDWFVEGIWDNPFETGAFDTSPSLMGSGGMLVDNEVLFCTPCHTLERLHVIRSGLQLLISNSLAFVLTQAQESLDLHYMSYEYDLRTFTHGINRYKEFIPTGSGNCVYLYYYCNIQIDSALNIRKFSKTDPPDFTDYTAYRNFLSISLNSLFENARAKSRKVQYCPLATISSGYDSPTCAALASEAGCRRAITFRNARPPIYKKNLYLEDSGAHIAKILGLEVKEIDRAAYIANKGLTVPEFVACGDLGGDLQLLAYEDECQQAVLITGFHGDRVWERQCDEVTPYIVRADASGSSMYEFRLRVGFIHLPISMLGCVRHPSIHKISQSKEMQPWILGTSYDRPIARRILEEKGVDRNLFGQQKKAVGVMLSHSLKHIEYSMNHDSFHSFKEFYKNNRSYISFEKRLFYNMMYTLCVINFYLNLIFHKTKIPINTSNLNILRKYRKNPCVTSFLLHWGIATISDRYITELHMDTVDL
jgi:hypothetical protein